MATPISPGPALSTRSGALRHWRWRSSSDRGSASSRATARRTRSRVTTSCWCCSAASSWPLAGSGSIPARRLAPSANGNLRISSVAVNTMLAGMAGSFGAMYYMWLRYGKPDASMTGNGLLAGLVAITAPSGFVNPMASVIIGLIAGVLCRPLGEFVERVLKLDDVVGAISVHGTNGLWGVISVGLFADGKSNFGGAWNGVPGSVTGLFYGDAGQLVAQLIGVATLDRLRLHVQLRAEHDPRGRVGPPRVAPKVELEGLDIPEMGALGYPEFVLKPEPVFCAGHQIMRSMSTDRTRSQRGRRGGAAAAVVASAGSVAGSLRRSRRRNCRYTSRHSNRRAWRNRTSADLRMCLGMAHAMNYDVYHSLDALEDARAIDPDELLGADEVRGAPLPAAARSCAPSKRHSRRSSLRDTPAQFGLARRQLQEIRRARSAKGVRNVTFDKPLGRPALALVLLIVASLRSDAVVGSRDWKFFIGSCILAAGLLLKAGAPLVPVAAGLAARRIPDLEDAKAGRRRRNPDE